MRLSYLAALLYRDPLILLSTALFGTLNLLVALWDKQGDTQLKVARAWARSLLAIAGARVTAAGLEHVQPGESYVIASNHVSYMDTPTLLSHLPVNFRFLARRGLFKIPFIGGHLEKAGHISVPGDPRAALKVLAAAGRTLKERGLSVLVFPEGGRSDTGQLREFKDGAAYLAIKGGIPILPVCIIGIRDVLPKHSHHVRPGRVTLRIGEPIGMNGVGPADRAALTQRLAEAIRALQAEGHAGPPPVTSRATVPAPPAR
jgi:1-acyl-sn-glycerol-3-phosphate acyltransferase